MRFRSLLTMLLLLAGLMLAGSASAQTLSVSGKVTDDNGEPTIGATIQIKGTTTGTISDLDGKFVINCNQGDVLVVSYIGFQSQEVTVSSSTVSVTLQPDMVGMEEVVVVGYGVQKKKLTTGASVQVASEDIARQNATDAFGALQSQSPGVNITQNSGHKHHQYPFLMTFAKVRQRESCICFYFY